MAQVKMMAGIESISGKVGNYCFRTMKGTGRVYMHQLPSKNNRQKAKGERKKPSRAMEEHRARFAKITRMVAQMRKAGSTLDRKRLWKLAEQAITN